MGCLKAEFALSTVATVTGVIDNNYYEKLCRGVARNFYILRQDRVGICDHIVQKVHHLGGYGCIPPTPH